MFKLKICGVTVAKITINSISTVTLLKYINNVHIGRPIVEDLDLFNGNYLLKISE